MNRLMIKRFFGKLLLVLACSLSFAQERSVGSITYLSVDNAYMDLGKKAGVVLGDTVQIERAGEVLGLATALQISGSSSAIKALGIEAIDWKIGDRVVLIRSLQPAEATTATDSADTIVIPAKVDQVFLDSSAYQPRTRSNMSLASERFSPVFSGYLSTRYDVRSGIKDTPTSSNGSIFGQFNIMDLGIRHLDASIYMRGGQSSRDNHFDARIYSVMLQYHKPTSPFDLRFGRVYHPQFAALGTLDGVGLTWTSPKQTIAVTGGVEALLTDVGTQPQRNKLGILTERQFGPGTIQIGNVTEMLGGELARDYVIIGSNLRPGKKLRLKAYSEIDMDIFDQSALRGGMSLTRLRASANWIPYRSLSSSLRYSYREDVIDLLDTASSMLDQAARHALNASLSWRLNSDLSLSGQASYRGDGSWRHIETYGLSLYDRDFTTYKISLSTGVMAMLSYVSDGGRIYVSMGKRVRPWLDIDLYDEAFFYQVHGENSFHTRHLPEVALGFKVPGLQRLKLRTRLEQEDGQTLYRISLSASRQF